MKEIRTLIGNALSSAISMPVKSDSKQKINSRRSRNWVESLAQAFRTHYNDESILVFSKHFRGNRKDFLLNELLYDVCVCQVSAVESAKHKKKLYYIKEVLWQVESEFAKNSREALVDFNKLVLGSAKNKLFIGPLVNDQESFIDVLRPAAKGCSGSVFLGLIPHPAEWVYDDSTKIDLWCYSDGKWQ